MTINSRGVAWLIAGRVTHAFHATKDGSLRGSLCGEVGDGSPFAQNAGTRRHGHVCRRCKEVFARTPKRVETAFSHPCDDPRPSANGSPCRNCGYVIQPTNPGWRHALQGASS